jgi:hypothetical protein
MKKFLDSGICVQALSTKVRGWTKTHRAWVELNLLKSNHKKLVSVVGKKTGAHGENVQKARQSALAISVNSTNYMLSMQKGVNVRKGWASQQKENVWLMWMRPLHR